MPTYAVCYAHVLRYSKAADEKAAARDAFGVDLDNRITIARMPKSPKYMSHKAIVEFQRPLAKKHFHRTGNVLGGWEKEPGIHNVHWHQCPKCKKPIITEPASAGDDEQLCSMCGPEASLYRM